MRYVDTEDIIQAQDKIKKGKEDQFKKGQERFRTGQKQENIDLSFVDELSEEELDVLVEEVVYDLLDEGIELDAIEGAFTEYLEEAKVTYGDNRPTDVRPGGEPEKDMTAEVKRRRAEKQKKNQERTENIKKSFTKTIRGLKAKAHSPLADHAGKEGLIPAKSKMSKPDGRKKMYRGEGGKSQLEKDRAKYSKSKNKKQSAANIKVSMMGGGAKEARDKLRRAVFKDVKDKVGKNVKKKTKAVIDAPRKAGEGIRKGVGSLVKKGKSKVGGGIAKAGGALQALGKKMQEQGGELDMFDTVTAYLIDEGLVKDFDHAQRVMTTLDSALIEEVHAEQIQLLEAYTVTNADKKGNTPAYQNFKKGMKSKVTGKPMYKAADHMKNESLTDSYLKVYEKYDSAYSHSYATSKGKSTGDKLKDIAKKKKAKYDAQPQEYKNNPAFGDESHHSNAKNK